MINPLKMKFDVEIILFILNWSGNFLSNESEKPEVGRKINFTLTVNSESSFGFAHTRSSRTRVFPQISFFQALDFEN